MKHLLIIAQVVFLTTVSFAQSLADLPLEKLEMPVDLDLIKMGYPEAPVVQCPRPMKKYEDMLSQLSGLKEKIKKEACPQEKINALNKDVKSLEDLLTDGERQKFIDLIKKGTSSGEQLTDAEVATVQNYIDDVVKKVASVTGLVNNPACFDENEQTSTLSFLSSVISEVSGAVGALAGPFGAKISMGGKLAAGLLSSIDTIVMARKTYDYDKFEDQKNILNNICAYYDFKNDLDKETATTTYYDRLYTLKETTDNLLDKLSAQCSDCEIAINDYLWRLESDTPIYVTEKVATLNAQHLEFSDYEEGERSLVFEAPEEPILMQDIPSAAQVVGPAEIEVARGPREATGRELASTYFSKPPPSPGSGLESGEAVVVAEPPPPEDGEADMVFEAPEEPMVVAEPAPDDKSMGLDPDSDRSLGVGPGLTFTQELTIKALQTKGWVESELQKLEQSDYEGLAEDGRGAVRESQAEIEQFLISREAVNYLKHYEKQVRKDFRALEEAVRFIQWRFFNLQLLPDPNFQYSGEFGKDELVQTVHDVFRNDLEFTKVVTQYTTPEEIKKEIDGFKVEIRTAFEPIKGSYNILVRRCEFFMNSLFKGNESVNTACERALRTAAPVTEFFKNLHKTSFAVRYGRLIDFVNVEEKNYAADWLDSSTSLLEIYGEKL